MNAARSRGVTPAGGCALCGTPAPPPFRAPPPEGAPDLDLRPGEPTRSTLPRWVATCRGCGACAPDLAALPAEAGAVVQGAAYRALRGPARPFLRWAMICRALGRDADAAEATLQAAWALDDAGTDAAPLRRDAAALWGAPANAEAALRLVDVLRRAAAWEDAAAHAAALDGAALDGAALDENSARILDFQRACIAARDAGRHLLSSALRPPARTPHVGHGKQTRDREARGRGGFWGRLFGG